jgi:nucleotide-binding universal stress UspA family protein
VKVLIAVDFSNHAQGFLDDALKLLRGTLEAVWLLHVAEPEPDFIGFGVDPAIMRDQVAEGFHREHRQLQTMADSLRAQNIEATALLIQGETAKTIVQQAGKLNVDLIVVGSRKAGLLRHLLVGDVEPGGLVAAGKPVLLIPAR